MSAAAPLLTATGLRKSYDGVQAVRGVDLTLARGEILALIGPNGAGKSTLFNMLNGQLRPESGSIRLQGADVTGLSPRRMWWNGVGRTFQVAAAFGSMTVRENVQTAYLTHAGQSSRLFGTARDRFVEQAQAALERVGLGALAERPCAELAYGDVKRLELAVALTNDPVLLLMDEPTAGMALGERQAFMRFTADHVRQHDIGLLFTEHDMDVVFDHADRVLVLSRGAIIADGPPQSVRRDPQVRATYLGEGFDRGRDRHDA